MRFSELDCTGERVHWRPFFCFEATGSEGSTIATVQEVAADQDRSEDLVDDYDADHHCLEGPRPVGSQNRYATESLGFSCSRSDAPQPFPGHLRARLLA